MNRSFAFLLSALCLFFLSICWTSDRIAGNGGENEITQPRYAFLPFYLFTFLPLKARAL